MSGVLHRTTHEAFRLSVRDDVIMVPSRIYTPEPLVALLCTGKPTVRDCLLTRHHNGFVRARAAGRLLAAGKAWTIPFIIQLVGEYIVQILEQIDDAFDTIDARALGDFVRDNPAFLALTKQRVASIGIATTGAIHARTMSVFASSDGSKPWRLNQFGKLHAHFPFPSPPSSR